LFFVGRIRGVCKISFLKSRIKNLSKAEGAKNEPVNFSKDGSELLFSQKFHKNKLFVNKKVYHKFNYKWKKIKCF